jgi:ribosomal-protein-alanine N-acetyltransferase
MSEAVAAILTYGFNEMKLYRIEAMVADYNTASVRILEKFGFVHEGRLREHYNVNGKMEDSVLYGLLKKEFRG